MTADPLAAELHELLAAGAGEPLLDAEFDRLARRVFAAQCEGFPAYRALCEARGRTPAAIGHWTEIPPVPVSAFRRDGVRADDEPVVRTFETSGTTGRLTGKHALSERALALYRASMVPAFRRFVLPELESGPRDARSALEPVVLGPSSEEAPASSLAFMIDGVCAALCAAPPRRFFGPAGLDGEGLLSTLRDAEREGRPLLLLGTSLAFVAAGEWLASRGQRCYLAEGSRVMETGGGKGRAAEWDRGVVRRAIAHAFGVDEVRVVNEYGMTELCSQFYQATLREQWSAFWAGSGGLQEDGVAREPTLHGPPWARVLVCDPETLDPLPAGRTGVVRVFDLANRFTVSSILTEDLARCPEEGLHGPGSAAFVLEGRAPGAQMRGCSLAAEEWTRITARSVA